MRALFLIAAVFFLGCNPNIGDSCETNVDCSRLGTRFCDTSAPGGYCTIDGCDTTTCPSEAVCVRFFTVELDTPCNFDENAPNDQSNCRSDEFCICDRANASGTACVTSCESDNDCPYEGTCDLTTKQCAVAAHCAPESTERRWCQLSCSSNGDCRSGYQCRSTGTLGALPVPTLALPEGTPEKFCAPSGT